MALVWVVAYTLPHRPRNLFLLAASYLFYGWWDYRFLALLFVSTLIDFYVSHAIESSKSEPFRKRLLTVSVVANLSLLGFFKYFNFFVDSANAAAQSIGLEPTNLHLNIILPVGISFYTFQTMSYTIDVYRRSMKPLASFVDFALYVTFFPQLVAGPIERGTHLAPQFLSKPTITWDHISSGSWLFFKGLFKKVVIADNLARVVTETYRADNPDGLSVLLGTYAFAFQIYCDFSGYSDMARGSARWLGYELMLNFKLPYFAISPSDFWRRWHISLSGWLRDYLYIPLGGNRFGSWMTARNLMLTMLLGGLWHGANWTYVLWGLFHGAILVAYRMLVGDRFQPKLMSLTWLVATIAMFHLTCFGWLLFRAEDFTHVTQLVSALIGPWEFSQANAQHAWMLILLGLPLIAWQFLQELTGELELAEKLSPVTRLLVYAVMLFGIIALGEFGGQEFIYFQF